MSVAVQISLDITTIKEAIEIAIDFEKKAQQFYAKLAREASHPNEITLFEQLAALELEHQLSLQHTLLYYENPADYFQEIEKPNFEG